MSQSPYATLQILAEWAHRGLTALVGVGIAVTGVLAYRLGKLRPVRWPAMMASLLLPVQVVLGGLTVTRHLQPLVVVSHLGAASIILPCLFAAAKVYFLTAKRSFRPGPIE